MAGVTSLYCSECAVAWWPYQCSGGFCPECGRGTVRKQEPASDDADARHQIAMRVRIAREKSEHNHQLFEAYYRGLLIKRDGERLAAQPTSAVPVDAIRRGLALDDEPDDEPTQYGEAA